MTDSIKRIDPASFPLLGLLGAFACGPVGPSQGESGSGTDTDTDPTGTSDPTDPTSPTTTMPPTPECELDSDCEDAYCGYCVEGRCEESVGCCGVHGAEQMEDGKWRCSPPYGCDYGYEVCPDGYVCELNECVMGPPQTIPLPPCDPPDLETKAWNLDEAPGALVLADVDGDGDLDLALAHPLTGVVEIGLNDGAANFTSGGTVDVGVAPILALAAGDIDGDGDPDLAVVRGGGPGVLRLLFNDGAVFTADVELLTGDFPAQVFLADTNGDAALDVLTINQFQPSVGLRLGDGMGGFADEVPAVDLVVASRASLVDVSNDGVADLLAPITESSLVRLWLGAPEGLVALEDFVVPTATHAVVAADLDLVGNSEIVVVEAVNPGGMLAVWPATGDLTWASDPKRFRPSLPIVGGAFGELDLTPGPDFVGATEDHNVALIPGDGLGGFACEHLQKTTGATTPALLAVGDVDGDGRDDIVAGGLDQPFIDLVLLK